MKQLSFYDLLWNKEQFLTRRFDTAKTETVNPMPEKEFIILATTLMRVRRAAMQWHNALPDRALRTYDRLDFYLSRGIAELQEQSDNG